MHTSQSLSQPSALQREYSVLPDATMISVIDNEGNVLYANKDFLEASGYAAGELIGRSCRLLHHPDMPPALLKDMWATLQAGEAWCGVVMSLRKNGEYYWSRVAARPLVQRGRQVGYLSVSTRVEPQEVARARKSCRRIAEKGTLVHEETGGLPVRLRVAGGCAGAAVVALAGVAATGAGTATVMSVLLGAAVGMGLLDWLIVRPLQRVHRHAQTLLGGQQSAGWVAGRTDEIGFLQHALDQAGLHLLARLGSAGNGQAPIGDASASTVTEAEEAHPHTEIEQLMQAIGGMEPLRQAEGIGGTRPPAYLYQQFNRWKRLRHVNGDGAVHALLLVGLDGLADLRDRHGQDTQELVQMISVNRISQAVRSTDVISSLGDGQFLVLLRDVGHVANVRMIAEKIRFMLGRAVKVGEGGVRVDVSVGWALCPEDGDDIEALQRLAGERREEDRQARKGEFDPGSSIEVQGNAPQLYGPAWAPAMAEFTAALQPHIAQIVDRLYEHLAFVPGVERVVKSLGEEDTARLRSLTAKNLLMLASPDLTEEEHRKVAIKVGRVHAIAGVERDGVVRSHDILHDLTRSHVDTLRHGEAFSVLARRLIRDLAWQAEAYRKIQGARHDLLLEITQIAWRADSYTNLIGQVAERLGMHEEFAGCVFGRPDSQKVFQSEVVVGEPVRGYVAEVESMGGFLLNGPEPLEWGPTGRCWHTRQIEHCINVETDRRMEPWRAVARRYGLNSMAAVPLCHLNGEPMAVLSIYSHLPGGFTSAEQGAFLAQLQSLLMFAIVRIENREGTTHAMPFALRQHLSGLLRNGGLDMHYQPLVELHTGKVVQVEALARLKDGTRTLFPGEFMSALSSDDLLVLYRLGLQQALSHRAFWLQDGFDLRVSINLPPDAFSDLRYYEATRDALAESGFPPHLLTLEVLESEEIPKDGDATAILARFKELGVHLSEDDLGSGHSSLTRLRELPFDSIKIDRSIVTLADQDPSNVLRFIYQLTRLGHSLGKQVVVEGVENTDMLEAIRILGPDIVQGYVIARPMPAQHLREWLKSRHEFSTPKGAVSPQSTLAKLAGLLIWEERLHMHLHLGGSATAGQQSGMPGGQESPESTEQILNAPTALPVDPGDAIIHQALFATAIEHGLHSAEYRTMRQQLVAMLTV